MSRFEVDTEEVSKAGTAASKSAAAINTEVANMFKILLALQEAWRGSASNAFTELSAQWRITQQQVEDNLQQISNALASSARQYGDVEQSTTTMFNRR